MNQKFHLIVLLFLLVCSYAFGLLKPGIQAPDFTLKDADENSYSLSEMRGKTIVLLIGTREAQKEGDKWILAIDKDYKQYQNLTYYLIADLRGLPFFVTKGMVKWGVRRENLPFKTLLDWDGKTAERYKAKKGLPNLFIIDRNGKLAYSFSGKLSDETYAKFKQKLDSILFGSNLEQYQELLHLFKKIIPNIIRFLFFQLWFKPI